MPTWNKIHIERHGRWIYRVEDERHWEADFPGLGHWTNNRWWKIKPQASQGKMLGNTGGARQHDPYIAGRGFAGFASWPCRRCCGSPTRSSSTTSSTCRSRPAAPATWG